MMRVRVARKEGLSTLGLNRNSVVDKETFKGLSNEGTSSSGYPCLDQNGALAVMMFSPSRATISSF